MRPALLVIDMQEHFRDIGSFLVRRLNALIDTCRALEVPVIFTQHGHVDLSERNSVLVRWWGAADSIRYGSRAWELLPELHREPCDHVVTSKRTYDAFQGTELLQLLHQQGVDTLVVAGVMTNLCCETTARTAFTKNFNVLFLSDGTATAAKRMHDASLTNLAYGFATVLTCAEAEKALRGGVGAKAGAGQPEHALTQ